MNRLISIVLFCCCLFFLILSSFTSWPQPRGKIIFCDVGQGDAVLFTSGFLQVLIDVGPDEHVIDCLAKYLPVWDTRVEFVVLTHPDLDHIGGFDVLTERYSVGTVFTEDWDKNTDEWAKIRNSLVFNTKQTNQKQALPARSIAQFREIEIAQNIQFTVLSASSRAVSPNQGVSSVSETELSDKKAQKMSKLEGENDDSINLIIDFFGVTILLTGDASEKVESALVNRGLIQETNILKSPHHGSKTSSSQAFLLASKPELIVISVGKDNSYGHPDVEVINRYIQSGANVLRTSEIGDVVIEVERGVWRVKK